MARMTERQRRFVDEYLIDLNATQAAIRAGYFFRKKGFRRWQNPARGIVFYGEWNMTGVR